MNYADIEPFLIACQEAAPKSQIRWCGSDRFRDENMDGVSPGGELNRFDYYVIGTTVGGNGIVAGIHDSRICFADHTWYGEDEIGYQDLGGDKKWHCVPLTAENVRKSLFQLAGDKAHFIERLRSGEIETVLDEID
jgi:hypothetical protein